MSFAGDKNRKEITYPYAVIIAVGGSQISLKLPGIDKPHVVHAADVYLNPEKYTGKKAVVIAASE